MPDFVLCSWEAEIRKRAEGRGAKSQGCVAVEEAAF